MVRLTIDSLICKSCGSNNFTKGKITNYDAVLMPVDKIFSNGSPLIYTFCKECGEVASIKVQKPEKF